MNSFFRVLLLAILLISPLSLLYGQKVYLEEASRNPSERTISLDTIGDTFHYTAFYKGTARPEKDLSVEFAVDTTKVKTFNANSGTTYKLLPESSYWMSLLTATIEKGSISTQTGVVNIFGASGLKPFEKYLLPISVRLVEGPAEVEPERSTIYYVIQAVPVLDSIPQKQIGKLQGSIVSVFGYDDKYLISVSDDLVLTAYRYLEDNLGNSVPVEGSSYLKDLDIILNFRDHHIIGLNRRINGGQLWSFPITTDAGKILPMDKVFGTAGYAEFSNIISYENNLYCLTSSGELKNYPLTDSMEWRSHAIRSMGSGWNYPILLGYENSLIAVDKEGDMWKYPLLDDGLPGFPKLIGRGWHINDKIVVMGNDLLRVDKKGVVWRIAYSDFGNWVL